ncbi:MAG: NADP-dependent malic enzyme [bacterium]
MNFGVKSIKFREEKNVLRVIPNVTIQSREDLSVHYTPGIAEVSKAIAKDPEKVFDLTIKRNSVAVISDGSAVLGLGNIGPEAALPVMEGKCLLFAKFADIDAFPICLKTQDTNEIINIIRNISTSFGGINLEDISAPRCFEIEEKLQDLGIPVMHDDQHGTAVVVLAGLINALKVVNKNIEKTKIVISGAGAAGTAIATILTDYSNHKAKIVVIDREGAIAINRPKLTPAKHKLAQLTQNKEHGELSDIIQNADVYIGVSAPNILSGAMVKSMRQDAIVFALANPIAEIDPIVAQRAGAKIVATGRSDFPNQINNVLAFPGIFRGALDAGAKTITKDMLLAAATALAGYVKSPTFNEIMPSPLDQNVVKIVANAVFKATKK